MQARWPATVGSVVCDGLELADSLRPYDVAEVRAALADTSPRRRQARRNGAAQHTWEVRVEQLSALIEAQLGVKAVKR